MSYELNIEKFSGPLEKLLELIEAEKLEIGEISMAKVTDDFLTYLGEFRAQASAEGEEALRVDLRVLADFIAVASKLIFLKSKYILPGLTLTEEEEADIKDLEERLRHYQALKPALKHLHALWRTNHRSFSRPYLAGRSAAMAASGAKVFLPGTTVTTHAMRESLDRIFETVKTYAFETETIKERIVTLEEKISEVLSRVKADGDMHFKKISGARSRAEMIVLFLAILHLAREQLIMLEQMENFSDIMVRQNGVVH